MNTQKTVLIVDADRTERELVCETLAGQGLHLVVTRNMYQALHHIEHLAVDILIAQLRAERIDGLTLLDAAAQHQPDVGVIFITAPNILETDIGIKAMLAYKDTFFLPKPVNPVHLAALLQRTLENQRLAFENRQLQSQIDEKEGLRRLTGKSPQITKIRDMITQIAPTKATVMIYGARGTGKELVARAIHHRSLRRGSLIAFNCATLNENLAESELFGHERGRLAGRIINASGDSSLHMAAPCSLTRSRNSAYPIKHAFCGSSKNANLNGSVVTRLFRWMSVLCVPQTTIWKPLPADENSSQISMTGLTSCRSTFQHFRNVLKMFRCWLKISLKSLANRTVSPQ